MARKSALPVRPSPQLRHSISRPRCACGCSVRTPPRNSLPLVPPSHSGRARAPPPRLRTPRPRVAPSPPLPRPRNDAVGARVALRQLALDGAQRLRILVDGEEDGDGPSTKRGSSHAPERGAPIPAIDHVLQGFYCAGPLASVTVAVRVWPRRSVMRILILAPGFFPRIRVRDRVRRGDRAPVDRDDHVAGHESCGRGGASRTTPPMTGPDVEKSESRIWLETCTPRNGVAPTWIRLEAWPASIRLAIERARAIGMAYACVAVPERRRSGWSRQCSCR